MDIIRKNKVLSNIASLSFTKGIDIFIPLLLVPFLVNNLGVDKYGVFVTCLVTLNFLMRFTDFGINVNSSIKIAGNNKIKHVLHILIVSTQAKILLLVPALIFFYLLSISFGLEYFYASLLLSIALVCDTLSPFSFYQGLQQLKCYAFTCLAWRVISAVLTLFLVKSNEDFLLYCLLYSLPYAGILLSLYAPIIKKTMRILYFNGTYIKSKKLYKKVNGYIHSDL